MFESLAVAIVSWLNHLAQHLNPVAVHLGPLAIRWYSLAYLAGFFGGWAYARHLAKMYQHPKLEPAAIDDFAIWVMCGVILGGRLGYVLFYNAGYYVHNPADILKLWHGGMSFHGGLIGVAVAVMWFARRLQLPTLMLGDIAATVVPIGLFFGRIANFINGELYGRATTSIWGVLFRTDATKQPRHPSQLYEAVLEGLVLGVVLWLSARNPAVRQRPGFLFGLFLAGYGIGRFVVEFVREPDAHIGLLWGLSRGQYLCMPMIALGLALMLFAHWRHQKHA